MNFIKIGSQAFNADKIESFAIERTSRAIPMPADEVYCLMVYLTDRTESVMAAVGSKTEMEALLSAVLA